MAPEQEVDKCRDCESVAELGVIGQVRGEVRSTSLCRPCYNKRIKEHTIDMVNDDNIYVADFELGSL